MNTHMILWRAIMGDLLLQRQLPSWPPRMGADDHVTLPHKDERTRPA